MMTVNNYTTRREAAIACLGTPAGQGFDVMPGDEIFATAVQFGRTVYNAVFSGARTVKELVAQVIAAMGTVTGLVTISLRNRTQGTTARRVVRVGGSQHRHVTPGVQLTLAL